MDHDALLFVAAQAALEAGDAILDVYGSDFTVTHKDDASPLTLADERAHAIIATALAPTGLPVLSEEGEPIAPEARAHWDRLWLVDPLDGTKEFVRRNGEFTVNIALVVAGEPVLGVIFAPVLGTLYLGGPEIGAHLVTQPERTAALADWLAVGQRLPVASPRTTYVVVASRSHRNPETDQLIARVEQEHGLVEEVSVGSSLKFCWVAEGRADLYPRLSPTMEWDTAAGHAIALAAGRRVVHAATGEALRYNKPDLRNPSFLVQ